MARNHPRVAAVATRWPVPVERPPNDERPRYARVRTHRPPPHSVQLDHGSFLIPESEWPESSDSEGEAFTSGTSAKTGAIHRIKTMQPSQGMSRALAHEFANLLLILRMEENDKPRDKRAPMQSKRHPANKCDATTEGPKRDRHQMTQALLATAIAAGGSLERTATRSHQALAEAGMLALQSPPVWAAPSAAKIDEMINPACTWHGPLVRERCDRLTEHTKDSITVVCGTDASESVYLQAAKTGCLRAKLQVAAGEATEHVSIRTVVDSGAAWTALRAYNRSHQALAEAGILALQSPPVWAAPPAAKIDEMINPACTWHGPLVRERCDRLTEHTKDSITVVCGTDASESVYLQAAKTGCLRAKLQVAAGEATE